MVKQFYVSPMIIHQRKKAVCAINISNSVKNIIGEIINYAVDSNYEIKSSAEVKEQIINPVVEVKD